MSQSAKFTERRRKPRWGTLVLVGLAHVAIVFGLARVFAPDFTASVIEEATSLVTVTVYTPPPPEPSPDPAQVEEGAAAEEGRRATPREVVAPPVPRPRNTPAPRAASTGRENASGARDQGAGTGAGGTGDGTGAGRGGGGQGGIPVTRPVKTAGDITNADVELFPIPPGGRQSRFGQEVVVYMTVGIDGRASNCRVTEPSNDPAADRIVCRLAVERFRFRPARDAEGNPVPADYGWRQRFFPRE